MRRLAMRRARQLDAAAAELREELLGVAKKSRADALSGMGPGHDEDADAADRLRPVENRRREGGDEPDDGPGPDGDEDRVIRSESPDPVDLRAGESRLKGMTELRQELRDRAGVVLMGGPNLQPGLKACPHDLTISSAAGRGRCA